MPLQILIILISAVLIDSAKILAVFPTPSISHQVVFRPIINELLKKGHSIVLFTPNPMEADENPQNLKQINLHNVSYPIWNKRKEKVHLGEEYYKDNKGVFASIDRMVYVFEQQLKTEEVKNLFKSGEQFDLLLLESWFKLALGFAHVFNAPVVEMSSIAPVLDGYEYLGAQIHPLLYPTIIQRKIYNLTFLEKCKMVYNYVGFRKYYQDKERRDDEMLKQHFGEDFPGLSKMKERVLFQLSNMNAIWQGCYPNPTGLIHMGGVHLRPPKELPQDLQSFLDRSRGVIYVSYGNNVLPSRIPRAGLDAMVSAFARVPYDIIWRWDEDGLPEMENVKVVKWLPQLDVLRHPKVKLFITQAGLQSSEEAIEAGVPLIGIPMASDQFTNAGNYPRLGIGLMMELETVEEQLLVESIMRIVGDNRYYSNIRKLRARIKNRIPPLQLAVHWIERVLHFGEHVREHVRSPAANMLASEYFEIELLVICVVSLFFMFSVVLLCVSYCSFKFLKCIKLNKCKSN